MLDEAWPLSKGYRPVRAGIAAALLVSLFA